MSSVEIKLKTEQYSVLIDSGILARLGELVYGLAPHSKAALIADGAVYSFHGKTAESALIDAGYSLTVEQLPSGEDHKNLSTVAAVYQKLVLAGLERKSPIVALGGGVAGDTAGFIAATYLRGVPFIQCPTTLLAMVDASVGGKTGVNLPQGKNLVGSFYQPKTVVIDPDVLKTLPRRELLSGLAECVKHGLIRDELLFDWIESHASGLLSLEMPLIKELIERNVRIKASVVAEDEKEAGVRAILNFGHTFAHAIENTLGYGKMLHGEAVAVGMCAAARLGALCGTCSKDVEQRLSKLLELIGLPTKAELPSAAELLAVMEKDKKVEGGKIRFVLPACVGNVEIISEIPRDKIEQAWASVRL